ncbi:PAS domain S-box protein [Calditerrivibrio nitroreducens]|uniref:PAS fold domain protein n=1 Tax=Calditerrivibrio nitroreducens (strain DSM 19672 / NBRC 101217 / Yu37-1) TaxID=768670 RepID=E4TI89_CALNY|nr:PAS domain S-box protein [Calditerrivibrio nitroreducens]ADR19005.1 PAS fold domain protein [Calditerrivibrio nitroreducens DSM 19672]
MENCFDVISDKDGFIVDVGGEFERIFGFSREEAVGQPLDIIIQENLREKMLAWLL